MQPSQNILISYEACVGLKEFSTCPWDHIWRLLEILSGEFARRDSWHKEKVVLKLRTAWEFQLALDGFCKIICSQVSREGTIH